MANDTKQDAIALLKADHRKVEELFEQGQKEFDRAKRKAIYGEIQKILADDAAYVFLYYSLGYASVNKRIGGVRATPLSSAQDGRAPTSWRTTATSSTAAANSPPMTSRTRRKSIADQYREGR